jgi:bifunctional ADP-heptose synthase (sugar kinase/adenylyltransferase)
MKILVVGDSCKDVFNYGRADRMCPEAPVPVFNPGESVSVGGMIHNVAYHLDQMGVEFDLKHSETESTKTRFIDKKTNQMVMRLDENSTCTKPFNRDFLEDNRYDAVIISDYATGYLSQFDIQHLIRQSEYSFVDTKQKLGTWLAWATFVKINQVEWEASRTAELESALHHNLIVTTGPDGCQYKDYAYAPPHVESVVDPSGAGDVFLAGLAAKYLECQDTDDAIRYAQEAAGQVVTVRGVRTKLHLPTVDIT